MQPHSCIIFGGLELYFFPFDFSMIHMFVINSFEFISISFHGYSYQAKPRMTTETQSTIQLVAI